MSPFDLTVMMYHYVRDPGDRCEAGTGIPGMGVAEFEAQVARLARDHAMIAWPDLRDFLVEQKPLPANACLLTFDDGLLDHFHHVFPILRARGLSGLFFALAREGGEPLTLAHQIHFLLPVLTCQGLRDAVWNWLTPVQQECFILAEGRYQTHFNSGSPEDPTLILKSVLQREFADEAGPILSELFERHIGDEAATARDYYLSRAQIGEMVAGGMHFGGHSRSHPWFDWVGTAAQATEIAASAEWLRGIEPGPWAFAYPYGGFNARSPGLLQAHGFVAGLTTHEQGCHAEPYFIGRYDGEMLKDDWQAIENGPEQRDA